MPQLLERDTIDTSERPPRRCRTPRKLVAAILGIAILVPATTQLVDVLPRWGNPLQATDRGS